MGGGGQNTTTQKSDPWVQQQPYLEQIFSEAQRQYQGAGPTYFGSSAVPAQPSAPTRDQFTRQATPSTLMPGQILGGPGGFSSPTTGAPGTPGGFDASGYNAAMAKYQTDLAAYNAALAARANEPVRTLAPVAPETTQAQELARQAVPGLQTSANNAAWASNYGLTQAIDPANNPFFQSNVAGTIRPMVQAFTDPGGVLSTIRSDFGTAGQYGGTRMGLAEGTAAGRLSDSIGAVSANMGNAAYNAGLDAQSRAMALLPQTQQAMLAPSNALNAVGAQTRSQEQDFINEAIKKWNFEQMSPAQKLAQFQNMVQGAFGGVMSGTSTGAEQNPLLSAAGGAAMGYSIGPMLSASASAGPYGAAIGAVLALLASQ